MIGFIPTNKIGGSFRDPVFIKVVDFNGKEVAGLKYEIRNEKSDLITSGVTDGKGTLNFTYADPYDSPIILVEKFAKKDAKKEMKPLFLLNHHDIRELVLISPKIQEEISLYKEKDPGVYKRATYLIKEEDTLESIAMKYSVKPEEILWLNESLAKDSDFIQAGRVIKTPIV